MQHYHKIEMPPLGHRTVFRLAALVLLLALPLPGCATPSSPLPTATRHYPAITIYIGSG
ncbi:hypothetical protein [Geomonas propionica]|uniref:Uncharacterized protein n=1 Tax=Geomonas propionica TaxID=2798582 RepID=A0ABS0YXG4_9BACT|nr:hypothetical protein [Geomonas propionica]MBJ6802665.1 hypothetical protein [Geomonas propionica]